MSTKNLGILIILFAICFTFCNVTAFTYPTTKRASYSIPNYDLGKRYLKLGNTYRETKEFEKSLEYLQKGQSFFKKQANFEEQYWFAVSLEYLGYYYRDTKELERAKASLSEARIIFSRIITHEDGSDVAVNMVLNGLKNNNERENYGNHPKKSSRSANRKRTMHIPNNTFSVAGFDNPYIESIIDANLHFSQGFSYQSQINQIYILNLNNRNLTDFPGDFTGNRVDYLSMSGNQLQRVPERINYFPTLQVLNLSYNKIVSFPLLNNLKRLQTLDLSNNNLSEIGASIGELTALEYLNLSNNPITYISNEIFKLKNLKVINVKGTKLTRYFIDDLHSKFPNTIILYDPVSSDQPAEPNNLDEDEDFGWGEDDDEEFEWEDW
ncbi:MAG: leucine-rich repeat domain-containing protein [Bacteroidetes bacterium]|nr:leucine-rich repeat domain-containing protein [Bacteroidota bacterium]